MDRRRRSPRLHHQTRHVLAAIARRATWHNKTKPHRVPQHPPLHTPRRTRRYLPRPRRRRGSHPPRCHPPQSPRRTPRRPRHRRRRPGHSPRRMVHMHPRPVPRTHSPRGPMRPVPSPYPRRTRCNRVKLATRLCLDVRHGAEYVPPHRDPTTQDRIKRSTRCDTTSPAIEKPPPMRIRSCLGQGHPDPSPSRNSPGSFPKSRSRRIKRLPPLDAPSARLVHSSARRDANSNRNQRAKAHPTHSTNMPYSNPSTASVFDAPRRYSSMPPRSGVITELADGTPLM